MSIFLCFICFLPILLVYLLSFSKTNVPPGPKKLPIIGNLHNLKGMPHLCLQKLSQKYEPVMLLWFGFVPMVVITSKEAAEEVLKTHDLECCSRPETESTRMVSYNFKDIGFAPYGEEWRAIRKLAVVELFSAKKFHSFRYIREEENDLLVQKLSGSASRRSPVNMKKTLFTLVASIVCRLAFGQNLHNCDFTNDHGIEELVHKSELILGSSTFSDFFPGGVGWLIDRISGQNKRLNNVFSELDIFFQNVLDDHLRPKRIVLESPDVVDVMVDMMKKQEKDGDSIKLTTDNLKGVISDIFLAGVNTSAMTLIWGITELIRNPRVMKKVQDEIKTTLGDKKERITEQDLNQVPYFKLMVNKIFRLYPAAPLLLPRETLYNIKIHGYDIPTKTQIMINVYSIARDPKLWKNPNEFNPDRFLESSIDYKGLNFEFLPFGSGRRICPGMTMGIATVELGLLNLLYFFDWALPEGKTVNDIDMEEAGAVVIGKKVTLELVPYYERERERVC